MFFYYCFNSYLPFFLIFTTPKNTVLETTEVDLKLCHDEFRASILARNALLPGISTLLGNLFATFGGIDDKFEELEIEDGFGSEELKYLNGASKEPYYIDMPLSFFEKMGYDWTLAVEGIYLECNVMLIGMFLYVSVCMYVCIIWNIRLLSGI